MVLISMMMTAVACGGLLADSLLFAPSANFRWFVGGVPPAFWSKNSDPTEEFL